ncbi:MAG: hypothetical protein ACK4OK_03030, partial [Thermoflexus sp.]
KALAWVEEVSVALIPEPGMGKYPQSYKTTYSVYWFGPGGQRMRVTRFVLSDQPGPEGFILGPLTPDEEMPPGQYQVYLALGTNAPLYTRDQGGVEPFRLLV